MYCSASDSAQPRRHHHHHHHHQFHQQQPFEEPTLKRRRHIRNERQRRVHMNTLLDSLQSLLPDPRPRKDRCTLLTDVIAYIEELDNNVEDLTTQREDLRSNSMISKVCHVNNEIDKLMVPSLKEVKVQTIEHQESTSSNTAMDEAIISFVSSQANKLLSRVLFLLHENHIEVLNATFSTTQDGQILHYIHAQVPKGFQLQDDNVRVLLSSTIKKRENVL